MTVSIAIIVEGASEAALDQSLRRFLAARLPEGRPRIRFYPEDGRIPKGERLQRDVDRLLRRHDAVIALTDVYTGPSSREFESARHARASMRSWVGPEPRFHPHAAQYEFEAWLLPYWNVIQDRAGSKRQAPSANPESVNHDRPPSIRLGEVFRAGAKGRTYSKTRDATAILKDQDLTIAANACPELKSFLNTILTLSGGELL